jgi:glycine/D-amino acid oxidase-like deaminating enzyme
MGSVAHLQRRFPYERSLWHATGNDRPASGPLDPGSSYDAIVIGGGIAGAVALARFAEAGLKALLVERYKLASGATGRSGGFIVPAFPALRPGSVIERLGQEGERLAATVARSAEFVFQLARDRGLDCAAGQHGWVHPTTSARKLQDLAADAELWNRLGSEVHVLGAEDMKRRTGVDGYVGGLVATTGGTIHPTRLVHSLVGAAVRQGATFLEHTPALAMERDGGRWHVTTPHGKVSADVVLVCTNGRSEQLTPGLHRSVVPTLICQSASRPIDEHRRIHLLGQGACLSDTCVNLFTYRFDADWRLISGAFAPLVPGNGTKTGQRTAKRLQSMLGLGAPVEQEFVWFGEASVTDDLLPRATQIGPGAYALSACNGRGLALSSTLAWELATAVTKGRLQDFPLVLTAPKPFRSRTMARFATRLYSAYGRVADRWSSAWS